MAGFYFSNVYIPVHKMEETGLASVVPFLITKEVGRACPEL